MLCSLASNLLNKWEYDTLKLMANPSWSSTKSSVNMRYVMKTHTLSPCSHSVGQYIWRLPHQSFIRPSKYKGRCSSGAATLVLPADTNYHLMVATHHLFYPKYSLEVSEVHTTSTNFEPRDWWFPIIDYALHDIFLMTPGKRYLFDWGLLDSIMMQW